MSDSRKQFYDNYVTGFKSQIADFSSEAIMKYWRWCDFKYLPILNNYGKSSSILELGCGPGYMLEYLRKKGYSNAKGIDVSPEQVKFAGSMGINVEEANVFEYLTGNKNSYNIIIALDFIEHFTVDELIILSKDILGALKPGGMLLLHTPNAQGFFPGRIMYGDLTHRTFFNPNSLKQLFFMAGFRKIDVYETSPAPSGLKGSLHLAAWKSLRVLLNILKTMETGGGLDIWTQNMIAAAYKE
ncbi:MAG: class I SAM-dependent methyltransferase [Ignavibacteriaceae bacterium]|nr:class I SAM-dependent methyltransferase [Ignavibacteriaceae bacterium]